MTALVVISAAQHIPEEAQEGPTASDEGSATREETDESEFFISLPENEDALVEDDGQFEEQEADQEDAGSVTESEEHSHVEYVPEEAEGQETEDELEELQKTAKEEYHENDHEADRERDASEQGEQAISDRAQYTDVVVIKYTIPRKRKNIAAPFNGSMRLMRDDIAKRNEQWLQRAKNAVNATKRKDPFGFVNKAVSEQGQRDDVRQYLTGLIDNTGRKTIFHSRMEVLMRHCLIVKSGIPLEAQDKFSKTSGALIRAMSSLNLSEREDNMKDADCNDLPGEEQQEQEAHRLFEKDQPGYKIDDHGVVVIYLNRSRRQQKSNKAQPFESFFSKLNEPVDSRDESWIEAIKKVIPKKSRVSIFDFIEHALARKADMKIVDDYLVKCIEDQYGEEGLDDVFSTLDVLRTRCFIVLG
uniref:MIF4G domain-containing protein n=1 Tax=Steinernema glaseri TaxID=37863 RepID=A0A1I8ANL4_9BILA